MKIGFYPRLAASGIRKNRRMFVPYLLTCTGMVMMFYIVMFLAVTDAIDAQMGRDTIRSIFALGSWVIAIFSAIFLFYTNSFLIRRRKKEFGLYNILGMGKRNIGRVLFWETLMVALLSIGAGLFAGILFSKLAELGFVYILRGDVTYDFAVPAVAVIRTAQVFGVIFVLLLLNAIRQVRFASAVDLMRSESAGEKPPKGNWLIGLIGLALLGAAYYISVTIPDPVTALVLFFVAVVMVIIATYMIMIAGSVFFCRLLQKKKSYYYQPNHFVSVSSMVYRMKRNGAGLASICILSTMVLVMMASTTCLYFGEESAIRVRYPREINMRFYMADESFTGQNAVRLKDYIDARLAQRCGVVPENGYSYRSATVAGLVTGATVELDASRVGAFGVNTFSDVYKFCFVPLADYNAIMGTDETLGDGEALVYTEGKEYAGDVISFSGGNTFRIKKQLGEFVPDGEAAAMIASRMVLVVPDVWDAVAGIIDLAVYNTGNRMVSLLWIYNFDTGLPAQEQVELYNGLYEIFNDRDVRESLGYSTCRYSGQEYERRDFYGLFGALFYIGIILSIVFILAAVLIIYYKQISEGYEDQSRFEIMQKVGMTKREIRTSINSQLLTVFFLPLAFAAMHLAFAFPIIRKLLLAFNLNNVPLFAATTGLSFVIFDLFYMIVYRITSHAYFNIVSGAKEGG